MTILALHPYGRLVCVSGNDKYRLGDYEQRMRSWSAAEATIRQRLRVAQLAAVRWPDPANVLPNDVAAWLASETFSPWTRCTYHGHMRAIFSWLADEGMIDADPTLRIRRPATPRQRPRPLSPDEQAAILSASSGRLHVWLLLGLYAGLRSHETAKLRGDEIDADAIFVHGKGGRDEMVPTHPILWETAQQMPRADYWFPGIKGREHAASTTVTNAATRLFRRLGILGSYHRCRHTYGTNLLRSGVNLRVVQELMRHRSLATTAGYLGVDADERTEAIRRLAA